MVIFTIGVIEAISLSMAIMMRKPSAEALGLGFKCKIY